MNEKNSLEFLAKTLQEDLPQKSHKKSEATSRQNTVSSHNSRVSKQKKEGSQEQQPKSRTETPTSIIKPQFKDQKSHKDDHSNLKRKRSDLPESMSSQPPGERKRHRRRSSNHRTSSPAFHDQKKHADNDRSVQARSRLQSKQIQKTQTHKSFEFERLQRTNTLMTDQLKDGKNSNQGHCKGQNERLLYPESNKLLRQLTKTSKQRRKQFHSTAEKMALKDVNLINNTLFFDDPQFDKDKGMARQNISGPGLMKQMTRDLMKKATIISKQKQKVQVISDSSASSIRTESISGSDQENGSSHKKTPQKPKRATITGEAKISNMHLQVNQSGLESLAVSKLSNLSGLAQPQNFFGTMQYKKQSTKVMDPKRNQHKQKQKQRRQTLRAQQLYDIQDYVEKNQKEKKGSFAVVSTAAIKQHSMNRRQSMLDQQQDQKSRGGTFKKVETTKSNKGPKSSVIFDSESNDKQRKMYKRSNTDYHGVINNNQISKINSSNTAPDKKSSNQATVGQVSPKKPSSGLGFLSIFSKNPINRQQTHSSKLTLTGQDGQIQKFESSDRQDEDSVRALIEDVNRSDQNDFKANNLEVANNQSSLPDPKEIQAHESLIARVDLAEFKDDQGSDGQNQHDNEDSDQNSHWQSQDCGTPNGSNFKSQKSIIQTKNRRQTVFDTNDKSNEQSAISEAMFLQDENKRKVQEAWLCYPQSMIKMTWDILSSVALVCACFMTPFGLAFPWLDPNENGQIFVFESTWTSIESVIDLVFMVELIVGFNTSFYEMQVNQYTVNRKDIARNYLSGWFWIDFISILPRFLRVFESQDSQNDFVKVLSFFKIARVGRLFKLLRLLKMAKSFKQKKMMQKYMQTKMKLNVAKERMAIFAIYSILFVHTIACIWIFLADAKRGGTETNWIDSFDFDYDDTGEIYTIGIYWTVTTITTVGYGDISATNTHERIVACVIMILGVIAFSFSTGSLSSIISNVDSRQASYRQRLDVLKELRIQYGINDSLYMELNAFINFQSQQRHQERDSFIKELPERLKYRVSELLYAEYKKKIYFFSKMQGNSNFISWLCPNLKPLEVIQGALIQVEQEKLTEISFIKEGEAEYVSQRFNNQPYLICSEGDHFGVLDIIFRKQEHNSRVEVRNQERKKEKENLRRMNHKDMSDFSDSEYEDNIELLNQKILCKFTVRAKKRCYLLQMEKSALEKMQIEFPEVWECMVEDEFPMMCLAITSKAEMISKLERERKLQKRLKKRCKENKSGQNFPIDPEQNVSLVSDDQSESSELSESYGSQDQSDSNFSSQSISQRSKLSGKDDQDANNANLTKDFQRTSIRSLAKEDQKTIMMQRQLTRIRRRNSEIAQLPTLHQLRQQRDIIHEESSNQSSSQKSIQPDKNIESSSQDEFQKILSTKFQADSDKMIISTQEQRRLTINKEAPNIQIEASVERPRSKTLQGSSNSGSRQSSKSASNKGVDTFLSPGRSDQGSDKSLRASSQLSAKRANSNSFLGINLKQMTVSHEPDESELTVKRSQSGSQGSRISPKPRMSANNNMIHIHKLDSLIPKEVNEKLTTSKKQKRIEKQMDDDEKMVMSGLVGDGSGVNRFQKTVKNLTKQIGTVRQLKSLKNNDFSRSKSSKQRAASFQIKSMSSHDNVSKEKDLVDIDKLLLDDQTPHNKPQSVHQFSSFNSPIKLQKTLNKDALSSQPNKMLSAIKGQMQADVQRRSMPNEQLTAIKMFQEKIIKQVSKLAKEVGSVKTDQEKLIKKSNQIRRGHKTLIMQTQSQTSLKSEVKRSQSQRSSGSNSKRSRTHKSHNQGSGGKHNQSLIERDNFLDLSMGRMQSAMNQAQNGMNDDIGAHMTVPLQRRWSSRASEKSSDQSPQISKLEQQETRKSGESDIKINVSDQFYNSIKSSSQKEEAKTKSPQTGTEQSNDFNRRI